MYIKFITQSVPYIKIKILSDFQIWIAIVLDGFSIISLFEE